VKSARTIRLYNIIEIIWGVVIWEPV